ncbi:MAG: hypothetical protein ACOYLB_00850 [Phototrophicaceae bacterium]
MNWKSSPILILEFCLLASVGLPWIQHAESVALTANLYDLAEWMTLHPDVRGMGQSLPISLALRVILVLLGWAIFEKSHSQDIFLRLVGYCFVAFLLLPIAPPVESLRNNLSDWNYRQQFILLIIYIVGLSLLLKYKLGILTHILLLPIGLWGGISGQYYMFRLELNVELGVGVILFVMLTSVAILMEVQDSR